MFSFILDTIDVLECEPNYDFTNIVTPVRVDILDLLRQARYDEYEMKFLTNGFRFGFPIGYQGPEDRQQEAKNLPQCCRTKTDLWNKMMKEVQLKRFAGPFKQIPFSKYI